MTDKQMEDTKPPMPSEEDKCKNTTSPSGTADNQEADSKIDVKTKTSDQNETKSCGSNDDDVEKSLGISEYFSSSSVQGFSAVVKARYSDFLVHEIDLNGSEARLTSLDVPKSESSATPVNTPTKPPSEENAENKEAKLEADSGDKMDVEKTDAETKSVPFDEFEIQLAKLIDNPEIAKKVMLLLESYENKASNGDSKDVKEENPQKETNESTTTTETNTTMEKFVTLPALEKQQRKSVHEWVRNTLTCARADTLDGKIRIWHARFEKEMPNFKAFGTHKKRKMSDRALKKKARANWPSDRPDFLQFVLYKENCDTTTATKEVSRRGSTARIGYAGMKDKRGITSQFSTMYRTLPEQIAKGRHPQRGGGGGNTKQKGYSVVHIGNFKYIPRELRLGSLKGNRFDIILRNVRLLDDGNSEGNVNSDATKRKEVLEKAAKAMKDRGFINYFGTQRFGKFHNTHLVGIAVMQGDFKKAVKILMDPNSEDRPDITRARKDWQERFTYGETKENESSTAKRVLKRLNRFMSAEIAILQSLAKHPFDYKKAFCCISKNLRMMFIHAAQSLIWNRAASYRIAKMDREKVLVGDLVPADDNEQNSDSSKSKVHIVTEEDVEKKKYTMEDVLVPVVGTKTVFPTNALGGVLKDLLSDLGLTVEMFHTIKDREIRANGDYRKVIIHPKDFDYSIKEYYHPFQPLLQTDLMKLNGEEITIEPPKQEEGEDSSKSTPKPLIAMVVGFTLPSSAYATIALRELMKSPTSNEFQSRLKLE